MSSWHVSGCRNRDDEMDDFDFSTGFVLEPGQGVTLHSGEDGIDNPPSDIYWIEEPVWNNGGEIVYLRDQDGNPVDSYEH